MSIKFVDPDEALSKPKKRVPKSKAQTPRQYMGGWAIYSDSLYGGLYGVRAVDPGNVFTKRMKEAIKWNAENSTDEIRAVIYSRYKSEQNYNRPTFGCRFMTTEEAEGIPKGDHGSLNWVLREAENQKKENTINNFCDRLKMLLGMLGDVKELESFSDRYRKVLDVKGFRVMVMEVT